MSGLHDFLTLCNMGILFNVLDERTYVGPGSPYIDILRKDNYDCNSIPDDDRRMYIYARGLSLELITWLSTRFIVEGTTNSHERLKIEDLQVQYITRQGLTMIQYLEEWIAEEKKKSDPRYPMVDVDSLKEQLTWAMYTIPWIETSWSDTLMDNAESFFLDSLYPASGQPRPRDEIVTPNFSQWSETQIFFFILMLIIE